MNFAPLLSWLVGCGVPAESPAPPQIDVDAACFTASNPVTCPTVEGASEELLGDLRCSPSVREIVEVGDLVRAQALPNGVLDCCFEVVYADRTGSPCPAEPEPFEPPPEEDPGGGLGYSWCLFFPHSAPGHYWAGDSGY